MDLRDTFEAVGAGLATVLAGLGLHKARGHADSIQSVRRDLSRHLEEARPLMQQVFALGSRMDSVEERAASDRREVMDRLDKFETSVRSDIAGLRAEIIQVITTNGSRRSRRVD